MSSNSEENSDDGRHQRFSSTNSARSQTKHSILKGTSKKNESDDDDDRERKNNKLISDDIKRYNSPVNSSRSISSKPPTGRLNPITTNQTNRDEYNSKNNRNNLTPYEKSKFSADSFNRNTDLKSDDEEENRNQNYRSKTKYNAKENSDPEENIQIRKKYNKNDSEDEEERFKPKINSGRSKNSARMDDDDDFGKYKKSERNNSGDDFSKSKFSSSKSKNIKNESDNEENDNLRKYSKKDYEQDSFKSRMNTNRFTRNGSDDELYNEENLRVSTLKKNSNLDDDIFKNKTKISGSKSPNFKRDDLDDYLPSSNKRFGDNARLDDESALSKEYEKVYNSPYYDKNDDYRNDIRSSSDKLSMKLNKNLTTNGYDKFNTSSSYRATSSSLNKNLADNSLSAKDKSIIPLPSPSRTTSLDRVNTNSAYNTTNTALRSENRLQLQKYSSANNLNYLETMSDKSTSSFNATNLSIKEAKSRSFLVGSLSSSGGKGLLGSEELEKHLIEKKARILIVTYNMAEMKTIPEKLEELVLPDNIQTMPDVYAIGTQEFSLNQKEWEIKLQEVIGPSHVKFSSFYHGSISINIFIRRDLIWFCSTVDYEAINLRAVKMPVRTKASILISFQLFGTLMCFICSHFESGDEKEDLRIENYKTTVSNITLPKSIEIKNRNIKKDADETFVDYTSNFDCVFWFGDLNFRSKKEREKVANKVNDIKLKKSSNYEELLNHDELHQVLHNNKAFMNFVEPRIMFEPTYKYDINTDNFNTGEVCRIPSYCDRILYRSKHKNVISCSHYDSVKEIKNSDHRPVYALLEVTIRPGVDKIPLSFGSFDREVYIAGYRKRQMFRAADVGFNSNTGVKERTKWKCPIQ